MTSEHSGTYTCSAGHNKVNQSVEVMIMIMMIIEMMIIMIIEKIMVMIMKAKIITLRVSQLTMIMNIRMMNGN